MSSRTSSVVRFALPFFSIVAVVGCGGGGGGGGPSVAFVATPTQGAPPLTVQFTDQTSGGPTAWLWEFGDGATSTEQNPSHEYLTEADYSVTLTVTWADGKQASKVGTDMIEVGTVDPTACDMSGAWRVASRFVPDDPCDLDLGMGIEDFTIELSFCEPCEAKAGDEEDIYLGSASITQGNLGGLYVEVPFAHVPQFALTGDYYVSSLDLTFETSFGLFDSGSTDCESFECLVSCDIYEGNALIPDGDGGYDIRPDAFLLCEGKMEYRGTRVGFFAMGQEVHSGTWQASDGTPRPVLLVVDRGEVHLSVSLGHGPGTTPVHATARLADDRSFAIELSGEPGSMSLSASGWIDEHGVGTGYLQVAPPGTGTILQGPLRLANERKPH